MASVPSPLRMSALLLATLFSQPILAQTFWQPTSGPYGGNVNGLVATSTGYLLGVESDGRVFRSTDQGAHWALLSSVPSDGVNVLVDAPNGYIFAATMYGIYRSTDEGSQWIEVNNGLARTEIYELACDQNGKLYAGSYYGGISSSTNSGDSWTPLGLMYVQSLFVTPMGEVFAGTNSTLYKYSTSGWSQLGLPSLSVNAIALNSAGHIFVATYYSTGSVLLSTDNGAHWVQRSSGMPQYASVLSLFINSSGDIFAGVYDVLNNRLSMYTSTDNGMSWAQLDLSSTGVLIQTTTGEMYFGGNGIYRSTNGGVDWTQTHYTALSVGNIAITSTNSIFAVTSRGLFRSTDLGDLWQPLSFPYAGVLAANSTGDVFSASYTVHRSTNNGLSWTPTNTQWQSAQAIAIAFSPNGAVFASTGRDISPCPCTIGLFRSTDDGDNWVRLNPDSLFWLIYAIGIHPLSGEIYASSWNKVYRSTDNGDSWNTVMSNVPAITAISVTLDGTVLVAADSGLVYRSTDHGGMWSQVGVTTSPIHSIVLTRDGHILAAADNGVFRSTTAGLTWTPLNDGLINPRVLALASDSLGYAYAGTGGLGVFRSRVPITGRIDDLPHLPTAYSLEQNYPNPFNPTTTIRYGLPYASFVTLIVYNTLGQQVAQLVMEQQQAGYHEAAFRGDGLASGVYFYRLDAGPPASGGLGRGGGFTSVKKLLLLK